jgi:hypothetical protein
MIMEKNFKFIVEVGYGQNVKAFVFENMDVATDFALTAAETARWGMDDVVIKIEKKQEEEQ